MPEDLMYFDNKYNTDKVKVIVSTTKPADETGYITLWVNPDDSTTSDDYVSSDELAEALQSYIKTTGAQTIAGVKTFSSIPVAPSTNPTSDNQLTRKGYVDAQISANKFSGSYNDLTNKPNLANVATSGSYTDLTDKPTIPSTSDCVKTSGNQTIAGTKTFSTIPVLPSSNPTSDNQAVNKSYADSLKTKINRSLLSAPITTATITTLNDNVNNYDMIIVFTQGNTYGHYKHANIYFPGGNNLYDWCYTQISYAYFENTFYHSYVALYDNKINTGGIPNIGTPDSSNHFNICAIWGIKF